MSHQVGSRFPKQGSLFSEGLRGKCKSASHARRRPCYGREMDDGALARMEHENYAAVGWRFWSALDGARVERRDAVLFAMRLGYLVHEGHVDRGLVYEWFGGSVRMWSAVLGPTVAWERVNQDDPTVSDASEWLAGLMAAMDAKKGRADDYGEARTPARLPGGISALRARLDLAERLRATIVRPMATEVEMPRA